MECKREAQQGSRKLATKGLPLGRRVGAVALPATDIAQPVTAKAPQYQSIRIAKVKATSVKSADVIVGRLESLPLDAELKQEKVPFSYKRPNDPQRHRCTAKERARDL